MAPTITKKVSSSGKKSSGWKHVVAGNVGGIVGLTISYPFDTLKVRMQTHGSEYKGVFSCARTMITSEGVSSLYRGLLSPCIGYGTINAVAFGTNAYMWDLLRKYRSGSCDDLNRQLTIAELSFCGFFAGITQSFVRAPVERVKTIMQANTVQGRAPYSSSFTCLTSLFNTGGLRSVFFGLNATIAREAPQYSVYYPTYSVVRAALSDGDAPTNPLFVALAGGIAGSLQWLPPFFCIDVVKSKIQAAEMGTYNGMWDCAVRSYQAEGAVVFFRGLTPALVRAFPLHAGVFLGYETVVATLDRLYPEEHHDILAVSV